MLLKFAKKPLEVAPLLFGPNELETTTELKVV
jgi:hypothetical protein